LLPQPILSGDGPAEDPPPAQDEPIAQGRATEARSADRVGRALPWAFSAMANVAVVLITVLVTLIHMPQDGRVLPTPDVGLIQPMAMAVVTTPPPIPIPPQPEPPGGQPAQPKQPLDLAQMDLGTQDDHEPLIGLAPKVGLNASDADWRPNGWADKIGLFDGPIGGPGPSGGGAMDVVFVIDRSGSMVASFDFVMREMLIRVHAMRDDHRFHVILFTQGEPLELRPAGLAAASEARKDAAADFVDSVEPGGRTDPVPALTRAFAALRSGRDGKLIYLLTDGVFPDNAAVFEAIEKHNPRRDVLINTILFGHPSPEAEAVLERIARENGGRFKHVSWDEVHS